MKGQTYRTSNLFFMPRSAKTRIKNSTGKTTLEMTPISFLEQIQHFFANLSN